jgi:bifunctional DNA-binding transcriptional regulator/antitoxin component of YhaV-PrlF toxin-antitoxin module
MLLATTRGLILPSGVRGSAKMNVGDRVFVTERGEIQIVPADDSESGGQFVGVIQELRDDPEDTIVALEPPTPNTAAGRSTIRTLRTAYLR